MNAMLLQRQAMDKHGMVVTMDVKGKILSANEKCSELSGFAEHEIVGKYITAFDITNISNSDISAIFSALCRRRAPFHPHCERARDAPPV